MANALPTLGFVEAVKICFNKYVDFKGRARRSEYWWWYLFTLIVGLVLGWIPVVGTLISLALFIPGLAVAVRRLHDAGRSGWTLLLPLGLAVLSIILLTIGGAVALGGDGGGFLGILGGIVGLAALCANLWLLWLCIKDSDVAPNQWGNSPKYPTEA